MIVLSTFLMFTCSTSFVPVRETSVPSGAKWHPGHYALISDPRFIDISTDPALASEVEGYIASLPAGIVGVQGGATWAQLEPSKGVYDFSIIDLQLKICGNHGKQLFLTLYEKFFNTTRSPVPAYIENEYGGLVHFATHSGMTARIWDPAVLKRFNLMVAELGKRYDSDPRFEGIEYVETANNCDAAAEVALGYGIAEYIGAYKDRLTATKKAFPNSIVIQETNWLPDDGLSATDEMADFCAFCSEIGVGLGGPDLYSDKERNTSRRRIPTYDYYGKYSGKIPLACDVQYPEYACTMFWGGVSTWFGDFTPNGLLEMGIETLKLNYFFWSTAEDPSFRFRFKEDVLPALEKAGFPINKAYPFW